MEPNTINNIVPDRINVTLDKKDYRKELWIGVAVAVARAENTGDCDTPIIYANKALKGFDSAFPI